MSRAILFGAGFLFLILLFSPVNDVVILGGLESAVERNDGHWMVPADSHIPHEPIVISSNADFSSQGWPGNGTAETPYVIEGLSITANAVCISITGTTVYFEIRDCLISSTVSSSYNGIVLNSVTHGTVRDCIIDMHSSGIYLTTSSSCTLMNNTATGNQYGFYLDGSDSCTLHNNTAASNLYTGISLWSTSGCTLTNNTLSDNGFFIFRGVISDWLHSMTGNWVNAKPLGYFKSVSDLSIDGSQYGQVILANCSDVTVSDGIFMEATAGIQLGYCANCHLTNNTASNKYYGFYLYQSDGCTLTDNIATSNSAYGYRLEYSNDCTLTHNVATSNYYGFLLFVVNFCTLTHNNATSSSAYGIRLYDSDNCALTHNTAYGNSGNGIYLDGNSVYNEFYLNQLGNNGVNAQDGGSSNLWDDGVSCGNYWMDYSGTGTYPIPGSAGSVDHYPFVWDTTVPTVDNPSDVEYFEGESGNFVTWTPYDFHPASYVIYLDGTPVKSGAWNSSTEVISVAVDGLPLGKYNYTLVVTNTGWNSASDEVFVTVLDATIPLIDSPEDISYGEFSIGHSITWRPRDVHPASYVMYLDGTPIKSGAWNSSSEVITVSVDGLALGLYIYNLTVFNQLGNHVSSIVLVEVVDATTPSIGAIDNTVINSGFETSTFDPWVNFGDTGYNVIQTGTVYSGTFALYMDTHLSVQPFEPVFQDLSDPIGLETNPSLLAAIYPSKVGDTCGQVGESSIYVTINNTQTGEETWIYYIWSGYTFPGNDYNANVTWAVYNIFDWNINQWNMLDRSILDDYSAVLGAPSDPSVLEVTRVTLLAHVSNGDPGDFYADDVQLSSLPNDIIYKEGDTGSIITWHPSDAHPVSYTIYLDGTPIKSGAWNSSSESISISVDGMELGTYNYTVVVIDIGGNSAVDTVFVNVVDGTNPLIDSPENIWYNEFTIGHSITWNPTDAHPVSYTIYLDGIIIKSGAWNSSSETISAFVDGLAIGPYNYTLVVTDIAGNTASDSVWVTVIDATSPTVDSQADIEYPEFSTEHSIVWNPEDANPLSYVIYLDGIPIRSGAWNSSSEPISISVDGLGLGTYNYTLVVTDVDYNNGIDQVFVTVIDGTSPSIDAQSDIQYSEFSVGHSITWSGSDSHPATYIIYLDGIIIKSGAWNSSSEVVTIPVDGLALGTYNYTIVVTDVGENTASDTVIVTVTGASTTTATTTTPTTTLTNGTVTSPDGMTVITIVLIIGSSIVVIIIIIIVLKKR